MVWVRSSDKKEVHTCYLPHISEGTYDDLWKCDDCGKLWRIGWACDTCNILGVTSHSGQHPTGCKWRPAKIWQKLWFADSRFIR